MGTMIYSMGGAGGLGSVNGAEAGTYSINGEEVQPTYTVYKKMAKLASMPYDCAYGDAVVCDNVIHLLGGTGGYREHYIWGGDNWVSISTLPYNFVYGCAVVYKGEIHILGGSGSAKGHYKYNRYEWVQVSTLPFNFQYGSAVVWNNEIHILGTTDSNYYKAHYKWDGSEWSKVSDLPHDFYYGYAVVYKGEIHILGGNGNNTGHYKWTGSEWVSVSGLPVTFRQSKAIVYKDEIYIFADYPKKSHYHSNYSNYMYKWSGQSWGSLPHLPDMPSPYTSYPYYFAYHPVVVYDNKIHLLGFADVQKCDRFIWDGEKWDDKTEYGTVVNSRFVGEETDIVARSAGRYTTMPYPGNNQTIYGYGFALIFPQTASGSVPTQAASGLNYQQKSISAVIDGLQAAFDASVLLTFNYGYNNAWGGMSECGPVQIPFTKSFSCSGGYSSIIIYLEA